VGVAGDFGIMQFVECPSTRPIVRFRGERRGS